MWRALVLVHALAACVLAGAAVHHAVVGWGQLCGRPRTRLARLYARITLLCYALVFASGAFAYPRFRHLVRAAYMDRFTSWASALFELKENLASLGFPLASGVFLLSRRLHPDSTRAELRAYACLVAALAALIAFNLVSGLLITMSKAS